MVQSLPKQITFDECIAWYPEHSEHRYELTFSVYQLNESGVYEVRQFRGEQAIA